MSTEPSTSGEPSQPAPKRSPLSAGLLMYRVHAAGPSVLLGHPGGPFYGKKDAGAWGIPKGLLDPGEDPEVGARREFEEELGWRPDGNLEPLGEVRLRSGKRVVGFALRTDEIEEALLARFAPGQFTMEWPPRSGVQQAFPEIDRIALFPVDVARDKLNAGQIPFLDRLESLLRSTS